MQIVGEDGESIDELMPTGKGRAVQRRLGQVRGIRGQ